jgi:hypothetical protein
MIEIFLLDLNCTGLKINEHYYKKQNGIGCLYGIQINNFKLYDDLLRFGITPKKSKTLIMPTWLQTSPLVNHFIRGYFDGDGSVYYQRCQKHIEFRGTLEFLETINSIIKNNINIKTKAIPHIHSGCGSLKYTGNCLVNEVRDFMYKDADVFLKRKFEKLLNDPQ